MGGIQVPAKLPTIGITVILASLLLVIPGSIWVGGDVISTTFFTIVSLPLVYLVFTKHSAKALKWLALAAYPHAAAIFWQVSHLAPQPYARVVPNVASVDYGDSVTTGLMAAPGAATGFLALCSLILMNSRHKWLALPLMCAIPFVSDRWTTAVFFGMFVGMVLLRKLSWRYFAVCAVVVTLVTLPWLDYVTTGYALKNVKAPSDVGSLAGQYTENIVGLRWDIDMVVEGEATWENLQRPFVRWLFPRGPHTVLTLHNVPLQIAYAYGSLAALAWVGLMLWALWRRPRFNTPWLLAFFILAISMIHLYFWQPVLLPIWWLAMGLRSSTQEPSIFGSNTSRILAPYPAGGPSGREGRE